MVLHGRVSSENRLQRKISRRVASVQNSLRAPSMYQHPHWDCFILRLTPILTSLFNLPFCPFSPVSHGLLSLLSLVFDSVNVRFVCSWLSRDISVYISLLPRPCISLRIFYSIFFGSLSRPHHVLSYSQSGYITVF